MPDETWEQLQTRLNEQQAERDALMQETPALEQVTQANAAVKELRQVLDATGGDAEEVTERLEEYTGHLENLGGEIRQALEDPTIRELTEGVGEGLEQFTEAVGSVDEALEPLEEVLDQIQGALESAEAPADQQIQALAEAFEFAVDKLGPAIERIPGLGAFFRIYAEAIRHIAASVGQIQATQRSLKKAWSQLRPGTTMYYVPRNEHEIHQAAILEVDLEIQRTVDQMIDVAREQREAIPDDRANEVDVAVSAAERACAPQRPQDNSPELAARNRAWREVEAAEERRSRALANFNAAGEEADRAAIRLEVASSGGVGRSSSDLGAVQQNAASTAGARERARSALAEAEADLARAHERFQEAKAPWDAMRQRYIDCVKERIIGLGEYANQGAGFTDLDLRYLEVMYPDYAGPPSEPSAAATEPTEVSSAGGPGIPRRIVIGGGGILAMAMVGIGLVITLGGGGGDGHPSPTAIVGGGATVVATSEVTASPTETATEAATSTVPTPIPTQPPGYTSCNIHPDEDAFYCRPYYASSTSRSTVHVAPGFPPYWLESTHVMREAIPTTPERPLEYRLAAISASGQTIEHVLSAEAGAPLVCRRFEDGAEVPVPAGDTCGQITATDTIYFTIDVTGFAPGSVEWVFSTLETEEDGLRRGHYSPSGAPVSLPAP